LQYLKKANLVIKYKVAFYIYPDYCISILGLLDIEVLVSWKGWGFD